MEFKDYKLSEIGDIITGFTPSKKENLFGNEIPFLTPSDITDYKITVTKRFLKTEALEKKKNRIVLPNSVSVSCIGSDMGEVIYIKDSSFTNQQINSITKIKSEFNPEYIYYNLKLKKNYLHSIADGSTMPIINKSKFSNIKIEVPSLDAQNAISRILSVIDNKIQLNTSIIANLEELSETLFKRWFVDFEFPDENGNPYKANSGEFKNSEHGEIPINWSIKSLYEIVDIIYGAAFSSKFFNEKKEGYPLIRIRDLKSGEPKIYTHEEHQKRVFINTGDLLIGMDAEFIPTIWKGQKSVLNQRVCYIQPNKPYIHPLFVKHLLTPIMKFFENYKVGTTVIHLGKKDIDSINIIHPEKDLLHSFNKITDPIYQKINLLYQENTRLINLRDTLLPKLMSGEIELPDELEVDEHAELLQ